MPNSESLLPPALDFEPEQPPTRYANVLVALVASVASVLALVALSYYKIFSTFQCYDDEGYALIQIHHFFMGWPLYDEIITLYGPTFFLFARLAFRVMPIGHDAIRLLTIGSVTVSAMLCGLCTLGLTRRPSLAICAGLLTGLRILPSFANEPGHPQIIVTILVGAIAAVLAWWNTRRPITMAAIAGALVAALAMTKVNVGLYAAIALFITFVFAADERIWFVRPFKTVLILSSVCLPLALISSRPVTESVIRQAIFYILPLTAVLITAMSPFVKFAGPRLTIISLLSYALGGTIAAGGLGLFALQNGATVGGLMNGVLTMPRRMASVFGNGPSVSGSLIEAALSFTIAAIFYYFAYRGRQAASRFIAVLKVGFALTVILPALGLLWASNPTGWGVSLVGWGLFLWVFLVPLPNRLCQSEPIGDSAGVPLPLPLSRLGLALLAAFQPLQSYPVAGSQAKIGTMLMIPAAIVCLADVLDWAQGGISEKKRANVLFLPLRIAAVVALMAFVTMNAVWQRSAYFQLFPLELKRSSRLRLPERQIAGIRWLVANVHESSTTFLAPTGFNSLYLWAGVEPASRIAITDQVYMFTDDQQRALLDTLESSPRPIVVEHANLFMSPSQARSFPTNVLLEGIDRDFIPYGPGKVEGYALRYKRGNRAPEMVDFGAWRAADSGLNGVAELDILPRSGEMLARIIIAVVSGDSIEGSPPPGPAEMILADSADHALHKNLRILTEMGEQQDWPLSLNVRRKLKIECPMPAQSPPASLIVARLINNAGQWITSIPFVTPFELRPMNEGPPGRSPE